MYLLTEKFTSSLIMYMIFKRIIKPWHKWEAYKNGIIDDKGKRLRKPKTQKERESFDILDRFCWSIKRLCTKYMGDSSFAYYFSAAYLMKEQAEVIFNSDREKYLVELSTINVEQQKIIFDCIKEMGYNALLNESHLDIETNLFKIMDKAIPIIEKYDMSFLNESQVPKLSEPATNIFNKSPYSSIIVDEKTYRGDTGSKKHVTMTQHIWLSIKEALKLKGVYDENRKFDDKGNFGNYTKDEWNEILADIETNGLRNPIFITVDYNEQPKVSEGNHRIQAFVQLGYKWIPAEIRYFGNSQDQIRYIDDGLNGKFGSVSRVYESIMKESMITTNSLGDPISDTEEGIRNFWKWFGNSKVVDEQGRPLVCYHGTDKEFSEFDTSSIGSRYKYDKKGFFFTDNFRDARGYAYKDDEKSSLEKRMTPIIRQSAESRVKKVYLNIRKPLTKKDIMSHKNFKNVTYYDEVDFFDDNRELIGMLSESHDGIIIKNIAGRNMYVAFQPNQIKSIDNNGNFSSSSNIITEDETITGTTLGDIAQFTPRLGSIIKRRFKIKRKKGNTNVRNEL